MSTEGFVSAFRKVWKRMPLSVVLAGHWFLQEVPPMLLLTAAGIMIVIEDLMARRHPGP